MESVFDKQDNNCVGSIVYVLENVIGGDDYWAPTLHGRSLVAHICLLGGTMRMHECGTGREKTMWGVFYFMYHWICLASSIFWFSFI